MASITEAEVTSEVEEPGDPEDEREDIKEMASAAESILFALGEPLEMADLRRLLAIRQSTLDRVLDYLGRSLAEGKRGVRLQKHGEQVRLVTAPENALYI